MTDDDLRRIIERSVATVEEMTGCLIAPSATMENYPFDRTEYQKYGYCRLNVRPITSITSLQVATADGQRIFDIPLQWIAVANLVKGQLTIQPMGTIAAPLAVSPIGGAPFLMYMAGSANFIPQFWRIQCTAGFKNMMVPEFVSTLVGVTAAIEVLSLLGNTYGWMTSGSLGLDGMSQSSSGPGPQIFATRIAQLEKLQEMLKKKFKKYCGLSLVGGSV